MLKSIQMVAIVFAMILSMGIVAANGCHGLSISKDDGVKEVCVGKTITYDICFANPTNRDAHGVVIVDELPAGVQFVSATGGGVYDPNTHKVTWNMGTLSAGMRACVKLTVKVVGKPCTCIKNKVKMYSKEFPTAEACDCDHIPCSCPELSPLAIGVLGIFAGAVLVLRRS